ncbi:MAG: DUF4124 domain-containing protein [Burkholderiaceae bacterium]
MTQRLGALLGLLLAGSMPATASAQNIVRCEDRQGRVSYSAPPCAAGTREVRPVAAPPPADAAAAQQSRQKTERELERLQQRRAQADTDATRAHDQERQRTARDCERLRIESAATRQTRAYLVSRPYYSSHDRDTIDTRLTQLDAELRRRCSSD